MQMQNPTVRDLVSWWALEEDSGDAADSHGTNHLTRSGTINNADAKQGKGINFQNISGRYLSLANNASVNFGHEDFTIGCWFKPEALYGGDPEDDYPMPFIHKGNAGGATYYEYFLGASVSKKVRLSTRSGSIEWGSVMTTGNWYFAVGWHVASENKSYLQVNNGSALSYTDTQGGGTTYNDIWFGRIRRVYVEAGIKGIVDEMFVYRRALNDDERSWLYNDGMGRAYNNLRDSGVSFVDLSGYGVM